MAKHFVQETQKSLKRVYRLILFDGFDSHSPQEFLEVLEDNVIAYWLPPYTSHFIQPLNVDCFQPYKNWHAEAVDHATRIGCTSLNKVEFLAAIESIRAYTFKPCTIQKGWRDTGLVLTNAECIAENIQRDVAEFDAEINNSDNDEADDEVDDKTESTPPGL